MGLAVQDLPPPIRWEGEDLVLPTPQHLEGFLHSADSLTVAQQRATKLNWTLIWFTVFADVGDQGKHGWAGLFALLSRCSVTNKGRREGLWLYIHHLGIVTCKRIAEIPLPRNSMLVDATGSDSEEGRVCADGGSDSGSSVGSVLTTASQQLEEEEPYHASHMW